MSTQNPRLFSAAARLREAIEGGADGDIVGPDVLELVHALGGDPQVIFNAAGRPALVAVYLVTLLLTSSEV